MLRKAGISFQNAKTWKHSTDPDFAAKLQRILALYDQAPADGRVICVDEFGPNLWRLGYQRLFLWKLWEQDLQLC